MRRFSGRSLALQLCFRRLFTRRRLTSRIPEPSSLSCLATRERDTLAFLMQLSMVRERIRICYRREVGAHIGSAPGSRWLRREGPLSRRSPSAFGISGRQISLSREGDPRYFAATIKSAYSQLEGGRGLRIGIVPESTDSGNHPGVKFSDQHGLWVVSLPDPNGFMGLFNDAYHAVARAVCTLGKQPTPPYYLKPSAKAARVQEQLEKYPDARVVDVENALDEAAQQDLVTATHKLVEVNAPPWLHLKQMAAKVISPKPKFESLA